MGLILEVTRVVHLFHLSLTCVSKGCAPHVHHIKNKENRIWSGNNLPQLRVFEEHRFCLHPILYFFFLLWPQGPLQGERKTHSSPPVVNGTPKLPSVGQGVGCFIRCCVRYEKHHFCLCFWLSNLSGRKVTVWKWPGIPNCYKAKMRLCVPAQISGMFAIAAPSAESFEPFASRVGVTLRRKPPPLWRHIFDSLLPYHLNCCSGGAVFFLRQCTPGTSI